MVNGDPLTVADVASVTELLNRLGVTAQTVAVMVNGAIVAREQFEKAALEEGAMVEIIRFVGGG